MTTWENVPKNENPRPFRYTIEKNYYWGWSWTIARYETCGFGSTCPISIIHDPHWCSYTYPRNRFSFTEARAEKAARRWIEMRRRAEQHTKDCESKTRVVEEYR